MIYFTLTMTTDEMGQIEHEIDPNVFCLWYFEKDEQLYGVIKDSAYELFIVACSLAAVQSMKWLSPQNNAQILLDHRKRVVRGNRNLISSICAGVEPARRE